MSERSEADCRAELERLREEVRARDEFLAMTAHELRNPLQSIAMQLALVRTLVETSGDTVLGARVAKTQTLLGRYANRLTLLLEIASAGRSNLPVAVEALDVELLLAEVADSLAAEGRFHGVAVKVASDGPCVVRSNRLMLEQVMENLVINAFKHAAGSEVVLSARQTQRRVEVRVADNGPGIDESDRERIFAGFTVAESSRRGTGTGLGLWIVRRLLDRLGGTVALLPAAARGGSTFEVTLPLSNPHEVPS